MNTQPKRLLRKQATHIHKSKVAAQRDAEKVFYFFLEIRLPCRKRRLSGGQHDNFVCWRSSQWQQFRVLLENPLEVSVFAFCITQSFGFVSATTTVVRVCTFIRLWCTPLIIQTLTQFPIQCEEAYKDGGTLQVVHTMIMHYLADFAIHYLFTRNSTSFRYK